MPEEKTGAKTGAIPARKGPFKASVEEGKRYFWCACGRSSTQPFCDGSHKETGLAPVAYKADKTGDVWFCGCKQTGDRPHCDGSHSKL
jgi:CDGSH-type Zn-finger protein